MDSPTIATAKPMPTLGVLGVLTGIVLKDHGFSEIHEVRITATPAL